MIDRIAEVVKHETAGDPMTGLKWTRKTTAKIAEELRTLGIEISPSTVGRRLKQTGYSLRVNHKKLAWTSKTTPEDRDAQFAHIAELREDFSARTLPLISIDTKKKELVERFTNAGGAWNREQSRSQVRWANGKSPIVGTFTRPVTAASEAAPRSVV